MFKFWKRSKKSNDNEPVRRQELSERAGYDVIASLQTDVGCVREVNEDSGKFVEPKDASLKANKGLLLIVADGMGGHSAGEVASRLAVDVISRAYYEDRNDPQAALKNAFQKANRSIYEASKKDESLKGMGTTCTALVLQNGSALSAHVGDSRLYLVRDGQIYLMTEDHSAVMEMVKHGLLTLEEARHHPDKNVILRAMGSNAEVEIATWQQPFPVQEGDRFLICSDALYDLVEDDEIKRAVTEGDPDSACKNLVALARERGGHDNITVGILSLRGIDKPVPETRELEVQI